VFIDDLNAAALLADKAYDADDRVLKKLEEKNCEAVILPKSLRKEPRTYDRILYKSRHLIENFFAKLKGVNSVWMDVETMPNPSTLWKIILSF
jgi:transposase